LAKKREHKEKALVRMLVYVLGVRLFFPQNVVPGWATLAGLLALLGGVQLLVIGILGTGSALWMAFSGSTSMWDSYTRVIGLFGGGLAGLFAAGIFSRKTTGTGALAGFAASALVLYLVRSSGKVHFLLYAGIGIVTCFFGALLASLLLPGGKPPRPGLTYHDI